MTDEKTSILVCKDAGTASRTLLARDDLRVRWALTAAEARAAIRWTKCTVCISRAGLAKEVAAACRDAEREVLVIVLLEPERWPTWRSYFDLGATAVLQATAADQLLDTMSDATGIPLRTSARVPFKQPVRLARTAQSDTWMARDLSASGISVYDFPQELGSEAELAFQIGGAMHTCRVAVSRIYRVGPRLTVGMVFQNPSLSLQEAIEGLIDEVQASSAVITEPDEEFAALDDETVLTLRTSTVQHNAQDLMRALAAGGKVAAGDSMRPWVSEACEGFSTLEVAAIRNPQSAPAWAHDAVLARLRAHQVRAQATSGLTSESDIREIFGLLQRLAESAAGSDEGSLVQVTNIRAEILRALYAP